MRGSLAPTGDGRRVTAGSEQAREISRAGLSIGANPFVATVPGTVSSDEPRRTDMTQYLLSVWHDGDVEMPDPETMERMFAQVDAFNAEVQEAGAWVFAGGLHP